jgi:thioredoxin reductase
MPDDTEWEVIVVGGGPAGLSAALTLARCRRRVLVYDAGRQRNRWSRHMNGFLTRDGTASEEFLRIAREQVRAYPSVSIRDVEVTDVRRFENDRPGEPGFEVTLADGARARARVLLLATGVVDELPPIADVERFYGRSVHHCPYCDGWEWRDQPIAAYGKGDKGGGLGLMLKQWAQDVVVVTDGPSGIGTGLAQRLTRAGIRVDERSVSRLEGDADGYLQRIVFETGEPLARRALFFNTGQHQHSPIAAKLLCEFTERGGVVVHEYRARTTVAGIYVAGDASRDVQLVAVAVSEGVQAAFAINRALLTADGLLWP